MVALAEYQLSHPDWLGYDVINFVAADADFSALHNEDLDAIVAKYKSLFEPRDLVIFRRSAWINQSPASQPQLDHWIARRNTKGAQTLQARQFENVPAACTWLGLTADKTAVLENAEGFDERAIFDEA